MWRLAWDEAWVRKVSLALLAETICVPVSGCVTVDVLVLRRVAEEGFVVDLIEAFSVAYVVQLKRGARPQMGEIGRDFLTQAHSGGGS